MREQLLVSHTDRFFRRLRPRLQVALCQLPLTVLLAGLAAAAPAVWPTLLDSWIFLASIVLMAGLFVACFLVPWERLLTNAYLAIPIVDFLVIGLARNGALPAVAASVFWPYFPFFGFRSPPVLPVPPFYSASFAPC
ncbi:hypothetical protein ACOM2C_08125 [Pseudarthrobacter sp. So.54]